MHPHDMNDHDLLIVASTKLDILIVAVESLKAQLPTKAEATDVIDHEKRIRFLEAWKWKMVGGLLMAEVALMFVGWLVAEHYGISLR